MTEILQNHYLNENPQIHTSLQNKIEETIFERQLVLWIEINRFALVNLLLDFYSNVLLWILFSKVICGFSFGIVSQIFSPRSFSEFLLKESFVDFHSNILARIFFQNFFRIFFRGIFFRYGYVGLYKKSFEYSFVDLH